MLRLGERRDIIFVPRPTDAASLAFLLLGVAAFAAAVASALRNDGLNAPRDEREGGRVPREIGGRAFLCSAGTAILVRRFCEACSASDLLALPLATVAFFAFARGLETVTLGPLRIGVAILRLPMNNYMFTGRGCGQKGWNMRWSKKPHPYIKYSIEPIIPTKNKISSVKWKRTGQECAARKPMRYIKYNNSIRKERTKEKNVYNRPPLKGGVIYITNIRNKKKKRTLEGGNKRRG